MSRRKIKDNDVYHWKYKNPEKFCPYHCKSQIAIVRNGKLYDTFWHDFSNGLLNRKEVTLKFQGNIDEMTEISRYDKKYYRWQDVVDLAHSNNSGAKVYIKPNVKRDKKTIIELIEYQKGRYEFDIRWANQQLKALEEEMKKVEKGNLDDVYLLDKK